MAKLSHPDACTGLSARPMHPFGPSKEKLERPIGLQAQLPHRSRRIIPPVWKTLGITPVRGVSSIFSIALYPVRA